jgi:hypothetical protein
MCASALLLLSADGNACCGSENNCDDEGCGNNWVCTYVVLDEISNCCGMGDGEATCNCNSSCAWCVSCDGGGSCGYCDELEEG